MHGEDSPSEETYLVPRHGTASRPGPTAETRLGKSVAFTVSTGGTTWGTDIAASKKTP